MTLTYRCSGCGAVIHRYKKTRYRWAQNDLITPMQVAGDLGFKCPKCGHFLNPDGWAFAPLKAGVTA